MANITIELTIPDEKVDRAKEGLGYIEGSIQDFLKQKVTSLLLEEIRHYWRAKRKVEADADDPLDVDIVT